MCNTHKTQLPQATGSGGEGGLLIHRVMEILHDMAHVADGVSQFESYYARLQRGAVSGAPMADEARMDFRAVQVTPWTFIF